MAHHGQMGIDEPDGAGRQAQQRLVGFGRAVSDPTRVAILGVLTASDGLTVADLTEHFGLHHSAIRAHLQVLSAAGLIDQENGPAVGRGRPARIFQAVPGALERWGAGGPHEELATMLVDIASKDADVATAGRRAGARLARKSGQTDQLAQVEAVTRRLGFEPAAAVRSGDQVRIRLGVCAFAANAEAAPELVCGLHRGVLEGAIDGTGPLRLCELRVADPRRGGCEVILGPLQEAS